MVEKLSGPLQESILTLLCMDDRVGNIAAGLVDVELLEPPYDDIARRALEYRRKFKKAPGEAHLDDIFDHVLANPKAKGQRLYQQVLGSILELAPKINPEYTLSRINDFTRSQNLKAAVMEAAERFGRGGEDMLPDAEGILQGALKFKPQGIERGLYLSDHKIIPFLTETALPDYILGIEVLARLGIGLYKRQAMGLMAPKGRGKTWACVDWGTWAWLQGARVLHISLEMIDEQIVPRYLRRLFAIGKQKEYMRTSLEFDKLERIKGLKSEKYRPDLTLRDPAIAKKLRTKISRFGSRLDRIHVKSFPPGRLSITHLASYMDALEASDGFVPDVMILDYPKLMKLDRRQDLRIALGLMMEELRGLCIERYIAGFFPIQSNRAGESAGLITGAHIGEDYSLGQTVDTLITYNQTKAERALGLARLYIDKARGQKDDITVLISQDYETGQFCRQSAFMPSNYNQMINEQEGEDV